MPQARKEKRVEEWGTGSHHEPEKSPSKGKRPNCGERMSARAKKLLSPGGHLQGSHCSRVEPLLPFAEGGDRERRTPYLLLIRHPILEVGHLGQLWPSPAPARGRPGRQPSDGITAGAVGRTRPETPTEKAPCQLRAGVGGDGSERQRPRECALP